MIALQPGMTVVLMLAVLQGITEFLPVSSSGHLVLAQALLGSRAGGAEPGLVFEIAVHAGTLGAIVMVYRRRITEIISALASFVSSGFKRRPENRDEVAYAGWILFASIPAAAVGIILHDRIAALFDSPVIASLFLLATGIYLLFSKISREERGFSWFPVAMVGLAQAAAILPGCSRSGLTITTALLFGFGFKRAAEFSFLLSIPAVCGALLVEFLGMRQSLSSGFSPHIVVGAATAFLSGWVALKLLLRVLEGGALYRFSYYLIPAGIAAYIFFGFAH